MSVELLPLRSSRRLKDDEKVVNTHLGQQLIDDRVSHARASSGRPTLLADRVQFVKDDDVQA